MERCMHQMIKLGNSMLLVFGGINEDSSGSASAMNSNSLVLLNDLHILNLKEMHWV